MQYVQVSQFDYLEHTPTLFHRPLKIIESEIEENQTSFNDCAIFLSMKFCEAAVRFLKLHKFDKTCFIIIFVSRVGLVSKCVDQGNIELIWFNKEFPLLLLQAFNSVIFLYLSEGIYYYKTGTQPPSCGTPRQPTMYTLGHYHN